MSLKKKVTVPVGAQLVTALHPSSAIFLEGGTRQPRLPRRCPGPDALGRWLLGVELLARGRTACDESGAATVGHEAKGPADEDEQPVLEADQVPEVDEQPGRPGGEAAQPDAFDVGDRRCSADSGQVALVAVAEGAVRAPSEPRADDARSVPPLLHRDGCNARQHDGLAVHITDADHVPEREYLRVFGKGRSE